MKPITPKEVRAKSLGETPSEVFDVFNEMITKKFHNGRAVVIQTEAAKEIAKRLGVTTAHAYENGWLNIEPYYQEVGWVVEYDQPGYNETYEPTFTFKERK